LGTLATRSEERASASAVENRLLSLSRNLGLITGASVMGAVFAFASAATDITTAAAAAITKGMRFTFATGALLILVALVLALGTRALLRRRVSPISETKLALAQT
jgi:hypothetical protein